MELLESPIRTVDVRPLKAFARDSLPAGYPLRVVLLVEDDVVSAQAFVAKLTIWLRLASATHEGATS